MEKSSIFWKEKKTSMKGTQGGVGFGFHARLKDFTVSSQNHARVMSIAVLRIDCIHRDQIVYYGTPVRKCR